ncbi:MAG: hypothetical protein IIU58_01055 [Clostridia bacterium]|nr:hypothetical protein [Clostridia bacterium]
MDANAIIQSLAAVHGGEGITVTVLVQDGGKEKLTVSVGDYTAYDLQKGAISEELLFELRAAASCYEAKRAALRILAAGQCSKKKLYEKLLRRGFSSDAARAAADFAASGGYIDENWQIESYLGELVEKRYIGSRKVVPMLLAKGYSGERIRAVLAEKYTDAELARYKKAFLLKKFGKTSPETRDEALEMQKALYKQGY